jgi:hypothetical protein
MISLSEHLLTLAAAARELPGSSGRGVHPSTVWRWAQRGVRGVRLETILVGGVRYTSREALERFVRTMTASVDRVPLQPTSNSDRRQKEIELAEREFLKE